MENNDLEIRMYFFVPHNLSPIQQAIQAGHAALEYADKYSNDEQYIRFIRKWKTWIILNGGTTNTHRDLNGVVVGTLNQIGDSLIEHNIKFAYFQEPDLNDALTAVCFIADERVWNYKDYPNFLDYILNIKMYQEAKDGMSAQSIVMLKMRTIDELIKMFPEFYIDWVDFMGGEKNVYLRELIKDKRLA